jgi:hypothetical protein
MTEAEWLECSDPRPMAEFLKDHPRASPRVRRLFMVAFWLDELPFIRTQPAQEEFLERVAMLEKWADTGKAPRGRYTNVFLDRDVVEAWTRTLQVAFQSGSPWETAPVRQATHLREVFGNPFRPVEADPSWLTSDVLALARGIYEEKAFDRMPILADALQDAGCANEDVLTHCRDTTVRHVRGCWVVDLVLGKG